MPPKSGGGSDWFRLTKLEESSECIKDGLMRSWKNRVDGMKMNET
jgi:hypothetical protein